NLPVDEGSLGVHEVKLVVQPGPGLGDGRRVAQHADRPLDLGQVAARHHSGRLVVDAHLENRAPVHKLDGPLGLDGGDGGVDVLGDHVTTVQHAAGHILAVPGITLDHLVGRLEAGVGDLRHRYTFHLLSGNDRGVCCQREVDAWVGHKIGLKLRQVHVQSSIESDLKKKPKEERHDLANQAVQVGVSRSLNVQVAPADVVDGLVVHHEGTVRVLQGRVSRQDRVVRLDHSSGHLGEDGSRIILYICTLKGVAVGMHSKGRGSGDCKGHEEALESRALIREFPDAVEDEVDLLLADRVVAPRVVVGRVFLARDELLGVEQLPVRALPHLI
ncbi:hypothetical protein EGW08_020500, partial [Elysia chlorotica]